MGKTPSNHLYALILCGGGGTRLWPLSRNATPKQFIKLLGEKTLFQITFDRVKQIIPPERIYVVTVSNEYAKEVKKEAPKIPSSNVIVEPLRRNTAIAHGIGAAYISYNDPESIILNLASDHIIHDQKEFENSVNLASQAAASSNSIVTIGIKPTYPHIGLGYLHAPRRWEGIEGKRIKIVDKFHEKPPLHVAERFLDEGHYYWNANLYTWKSKTYLDALKKYLPRTFNGIQKIISSIGTSHENQVIKQVYQMAEAVSVDDAISEKEHHMLLVEGSFDWTDVGDWKEVWSMSPKDKNDNVLKLAKDAEAINIDTSGSIVVSNKKLVAIIDVDDIAVIDTADALLVCKRSRAESVKKVVEKLKSEDKLEFL